MNPNPEETLAEFTANLGFKHIPHAVRRRAEELLLDGGMTGLKKLESRGLVEIFLPGRGLMGQIQTNTPPIARITTMGRAFFSIWLLMLATGAFAAEPANSITVYKTPTCGCCTGWVEYLRDNGFHVETHDMQSLAQTKTRLGLTDPRLMSCHTAVIDGYVVEGHVPANDIRRLVSEKPDVVGITAPGMPQMSPGMQSVEPKDYNVLVFDDEGNVGLFSRY